MLKPGKGIMTIISGFSGSGKGTVINRLLEKYPGRFWLSVSATTRGIREGEKEGVNYFFVSKEEFERMIEEGELLEYTNYVGNYYGTPKSSVEKKLQEGYDVILEIEQEGAMNVKRALPESLLIFLTPPTIEELENRLRNRGTESEEVIQERLEKAALEAENIGLYDFILINDDLEGCVESLSRLIESERSRVSRNSSSISSLKEGLLKYKKH
ncbi:MAG: guanylate kinase [Lachnospiraceae bacterium]|nr:guanylate kinase [Lachnospiraceae bacterium]